jgi:hypothetical protein
MRAAGRDGAALRLARDAAGVAVMGPAVVVGCSSAPGPLRGAVLAAAAFLTVVDALHTERADRRRGLLAATAVAVAVAGALVPATRGGQVPGAGAILLVLWYGLRGLAVVGGTGRLSRGVVMEYGFFVVVAVALMSSTAQH